MAAKFEIRKYIGNDCCFGMPVSSIGLKRVDNAVPAVYGSPVVPGDDASDSSTYAVYRPEAADEVACSFESIFKLVLKQAPGHRLTNIRIYPLGVPPVDALAPVVNIGQSSICSRATNQPSSVANQPLWNFSKENPFYITVNGNAGQYLSDQIELSVYNATIGDVGFGNQIFMNGYRRLEIPIALTYQPVTFINQFSDVLTMVIYDAGSQTPIVHPDVVYGTSDGKQTVTINPSEALFSVHPNGFFYGSDTDITVGGYICWLDFGSSTPETITYNVSVGIDPNGNPVYYLNDKRAPSLNFLQNKIYRFVNPYGEQYPLRFVSSQAANLATPSNIVVTGVYVENSCTANEIVTVTPATTWESGIFIRGYQSVARDTMGYIVTNHRSNMSGNYNLNTVGAGVSEPMSAGETDFIYLQLVAKGSSSVGEAVPNIAIEWDET